MSKIDILVFCNFLLRKKIYLIKRTLIFFLGGLVISFIIPVSYKSSMQFTFSQPKNEKSNVSTLASLAGININSSESNILSPGTYNIIISDHIFKRSLLKTILKDSLTLKDYLSQSSFNFLMKNKKSNENKVEILNYNLKSNLIVTEEEKNIFEKMDDMITFSFNSKSSIITISVESKNPYYSSIITSEIFKLLQDYVIEYNIKSSKELLNFNLKNLESKKLEFEKVQDELAEFNDNNQIISSSKFNINKFKLENKFNLINGVYSELAKQVELAKIQVSKDTPVFTILKNAEVPVHKHKPKRALIIILFTFFGLFLNSFILLYKKYY